MARWNISVKTTGVVNGVRLEKGMFIEMPTNGLNPLQAVSAHKSQINMLFQNRYGIDLLKGKLVNAGRLSCEKIG